MTDWDVEHWLIAAKLDILVRLTFFFQLAWL